MVGLPTGAIAEVWPARIAVGAVVMVMILITVTTLSVSDVRVARQTVGIVPPSMT